VTTKRTIYIPDHLRDVLDIGDDEQMPGLSARLAAIVDRYGRLVADCPPLSRAQWCLILDACNGWATPMEPGETLLTGLPLEVADHVKLNNAGEKWNLSAAECERLVNRLAELTITEAVSIVERVERFWRRPAMDTDIALAASGIVPTDWLPPAYQVEGLEVEGLEVTRRWPPRFRMRFARRDDGGCETIATEQIDELPAEPAFVARLMREAGDALAAQLRAAHARE